MMGCREGFKKAGDTCRRIISYKPIKTRKGFDTALVWASISGFLILALSKFGAYDLNPYGSSILMILAGIALLEEGRARSFYNWVKDGIQGVEYAHVFTLIGGVGALITGILILPFVGVTSQILDTFTGIIAVYSIAIILLQKYVID